MRVAQVGGPVRAGEGLQPVPPVRVVQGLPQLVQSRPQFGYLGAAVTVWVFALVNYVAYNTSDALLSGNAMNVLFRVNTNLGYFIAACLAALIALYGYHWIHRINRFLTWPLIAIMVLLSVAAFRNPALPAHASGLGAFKPAAFMTVFVIVAGFQLGWAPYVSDCSRYLPASSGVRSTFWWTYLPSALAAIWVFVIGAVADAAAGPNATPVQAFGAANSMYGRWGWRGQVAYLVALLVMVPFMVTSPFTGFAAHALGGVDYGPARLRRADLAVLDTDVLAAGYASARRFPVADAAVELTVAAGRIVHERLR